MNFFEAQHVYLIILIIAQTELEVFYLIIIIINLYLLFITEINS